MSKFKIRLMRTVEKIKNSYTTREVEILLKKPDVKKCPFSEYRTWVMTNYFVATGNRVSTVINLKICDINFASNEIILRQTKNKIQHTVPMARELSPVLLEYLKIRGRWRRRLFVL